MTVVDLTILPIQLSIHLFENAKTVQFSFAFAMNENRNSFYFNLFIVSMILISVQ